LESVELKNEGADPLVKFHGYFAENWLAAVGAAIAVKTVIQLMMLVLSLQLLGAQFGSQEDELKTNV